jgi:hypothetical protein
MSSATRNLLAAVSAVVAGAISLAATVPAPSAGATAPGGCGAAAQTIIDSDYEMSTFAIYKNELSSSEVTDDLGHVTDSRALASAVAGGDPAKIHAATHAIVYKPHWHIVRLRVLSTSGRVLADVGGPYILAPVRGQIRYHGKVVGSFVMSVQDDVGYEKLVTRFTGVPIEIYRNGAPLLGRNFPAKDAPRRVPPDGKSITVKGVRSVSLSYSVRAFPSGTDRVLLAVPAASAALRASSCVAANAHAFGEISLHLAMLINLQKFGPSYVGFDHAYDVYKLTFLRDGSTQLASSDNLPGPPVIPNTGTVAYEGQTWLVFSFEANHSIRVYLLFPDNTPPGGGATGSSGVTGASGPTGASGAS